MDLDFWAAKGHSATQTSAAIRSSRAKKSSGTRGIVEDEGDDGVSAWFPCPFCYMEIEVPLLCVHLQEEHCFDLKNAVCPICAANLGKDPTGHFTVQHVHSIKRRKTTEKGFWSDISTNIVKDLRELSTHFGTSSLSGSSEPAHDPLLSPFLCTIPLPVDTKDTHKDMISPCVAAAGDALSSIQSVLDEVYERNYKETRQRELFIQELLGSTILQDSSISSLPKKSD